MSGPDRAVPQDQQHLGVVMNQTVGGMGGWMGGGMWLWTVIGVLVIVLLAVMIGKMSKK